MSKLIATFFYSGYLPKAPGTWGSLAAVIAAIVLYAVGGFTAFCIAILAASIIGWWATAKETAGQSDHDPSSIVIDEVAGQWIALLPLAGGLWWIGSDIAILPWPGLLAGFVLFRLFDILKPWPVSWADNMNTPLGVMLDDIIAGLLAAIVGSILGAIAHLVLI